MQPGWLGEERRGPARERVPLHQQWWPLSAPRQSRKGPSIPCAVGSPQPPGASASAGYHFHVTEEVGGRCWTGRKPALCCLTKCSSPDPRTFCQAPKEKTKDAGGGRTQHPLPRRPGHLAGEREAQDENACLPDLVLLSLRTPATQLGRGRAGPRTWVLLS